MQHIEVSRHFDASPEEVWRIYTDHARWKEWSGFDHTTLETPGTEHRDGVGAVRVFGSGPVSAFEEVVEFEPPHRMAYRVIRGGLPIKDHFGEVLLTPDGDGTLLVWRARFNSRWPIPGFAPLMRLLVQRVFRTTLAGLARRGFGADPAPR